MIPTNTEAMKKEMQSPISIAYAEDLVGLAKKFPFKQGLEIGCAWGISTLAFLANSDGHLTSVDNDDYKDARKRAEDEVIANGLQDRWTFVLADSKDFWSRRNNMYDFIYVDGDHSYEYAHLDIRKAWVLLEPGGILAIDDVVNKNNRPNNVDHFGVSIAAMEHWANNPDIKEAGFVGRILWFKKP